MYTSYQQAIVCLLGRAEPAFSSNINDSFLCVVVESFGKEYLEEKSLKTVENCRTRYFCKPQFDKDGFFLVKYKDSFIGTAFAWQDEEISQIGRMLWVAVLPSHRQKGIAKALCYHVIKFLQKKGKVAIFVRTGNYREKAIKLYESIGFVKVQSGKQEDNIVPHAQKKTWMKLSDEVTWLKMDNLLSRVIPYAYELPSGYTMHTWQDGCEKLWFDIGNNRSCNLSSDFCDTKY